MTICYLLSLGITSDVGLLGFGDIFRRTAEVIDVRQWTTLNSTRSVSISTVFFCSSIIIIIIIMSIISDFGDAIGYAIGLGI